MAKIKHKDIKIERRDADHIFINNTPFISYDSYLSTISKLYTDMNAIAEKNKELTEENVALKTLLKDRLNESEA